MTGRRPPQSGGKPRPRFSGPKKPRRSGPREPQEGERLQKILAHAGVGSRRACEEFILQGRITINGKVIRELGTRVVAGRDKVAVDGQTIHEERPAYIAVNKPRGYVSTNSDPAGKPRVVDLIPDIPQRVYTVGRLDEMSVGLMLLTNDGALANKLSHPKFGVEKVYRAIVAGSPAPEVYQKLVEGVWLADGKVRAKKVRPVGKQGDATIIEMVLAEGKNREVRRMMAKFGHKVMSLVRVAIGPISVKGIKAGGWRFLSAREVDLLRKVADGVPIPTPYADDRPPRQPTRGPRATNRPAPRPAHGDSERRGPRPSEGGPSRPPRPSSAPSHARRPRPQASSPAPRPPRPARPSSPPPARRRIIGLNLPREDPPSTRRPSPRKKPGLGPSRPRPIPRRKRPGAAGEEMSEDS